jgi:hypothetical protein
MAEETPFSIQEHQLNHLQDDAAEDFFKKLVEDILKHEDIEYNLRNYEKPSPQTSSSDGGIDLFYDNQSTQEDINGLIKKGKNYYQVKGGKKNPITLNSIFLKKKKKGKKEQKFLELKPRILETIEARGRIICVHFGESYNQNEINAKIKNIKAEFISEFKTKYNWEDFSFDIYGANHIAAIINSYLATAIYFKESFTGFSSGAKTCTKAYDEFLCGLDVIPETFGREEDVTKIKKCINDFFLGNNDSEFLRIIGESGIGKTRLVLELLKNEFPLISIYYEQASLFKNLKAFLSQNQQINGRIVIVLDECDEKFIDDLSNRPAKSAGVKIFFICINNQKDSYHHQIPLIEINSLDRQSIQQILFPEKNNRLNQHNQERWAEMCGGSPYVASTLRRLISEKVWLPLDKINQ